MSNVFVDWFFQQDEFTTDIEEMNEEELNRCYGNFMSARKQDGGYYNKATL